MTYLELALEGKVIEAIKKYKADHNVGLRDAKLAVEAMIDAHFKQLKEYVNDQTS